MALSNLGELQVIVQHAESRAISRLIDAYAQADALSIANEVCTPLDTDGSEIKIHYYSSTAAFKTSDREDDVEFVDLKPRKTVTYSPNFKHNGLNVGVRELLDSNGEGADKLGRYMQSAGAAAGYHPTDEALKVMLANAVIDWDGVALFSASHVAENGATFSNTLSGSTYDVLGASTLSDASDRLAAIKAEIATVPNAAGLPVSNGDVLILAPPKAANRIRQITSDSIINATDNTKSAGFGMRYREVPQLSAKFTGSAVDDKTLYFVCFPVDGGEGGLIHIRREGLSVQLNGPESSASLARMRVLQYIPRFRDRVVAGRPMYIFRVVGA